MDQYNSASQVFAFLQRNAAYIGPQIHLVMWGMGLLILDFLIPREKKHWISFFSLLGIGAAMIHWYRLYHGGVGRAFYDMISLDSFSLFFQLIVLIAAALTILMSYHYLDVEDEQHGEYYALILFATSGMMFMAGALDLVTIFVGLELIGNHPPGMKAPLYYWHREKRASQAEVDYLLQRGNEIVPIEVKSGAKGRMQSLHQFLTEHPERRGLRLSQENFSRGDRFDVMPLYAAGKFFPPAASR